MTYTEEEVIELIRRTLNKASDVVRGNYVQIDMVYNNYDDAFEDGYSVGRVSGANLIDKINPRELLDKYGHQE